MSLFIHGWLNLGLLILVGTQESRNLRRLSFISSRTVLILLVVVYVSLECCWNWWHLLLSRSTSAIFHRCISLFTGLDLLADVLVPMKTMSWSPSPGRVVLRVVRVGRFVRKTFRMLSFLVGCVTIWCRLQDSTTSRIFLLILLGFWFPSTVLWPGLQIIIFSME